MSSVDVKPGGNRKPAGKAETANEPFKQALASCTRALARQPELEIAFSADKPSLMTSAEGADCPRPRRFVRPAACLP
jgi:cobaltochelatase CobT